MDPHTDTPAPPLVDREVRGLTKLRQENLSRLLSAIHYRGEVSRSELANETGITRSSVLSLVSELERRGLVEQVVGSATGGVGRPSTMVRTTNNVAVIAIAPRYDSIQVASVGFSGHVFHRSNQILSRLPSPEEFVDAAADQVRTHLDLLPPGTLIPGIGVAIPGHVRVNEGVVHSAYSLAWGDVAIAELLQQATGLPVWLDNDASLACLSEHRFGVGRDCDHMVLLHGAVGGIGGGIIVDGRLVRGRDGYAGELGHVPLSDSQRVGYAGIPGSLDQMVNRLELLDALGLPRADDETLAAAVADIEPGSAADSLLDHQADYLGRAIGMLMSIFNPEKVVLTGFLRTIFDERRSQVMASVRRDSLERLAEGCEIRADAMGDDIVFVGAAELPLTPLLEDPLNYPLHRVA